MKEYERSFKVKSILPFLEYCRKNGYKEFDVVIQNRVVYENKNCEHIIARITTETIKGQEKTIFDCKNVNRKKQNLNISSESLPMELNSENLKIIKSVLDVLEFKIAADNLRTRYVFEKDGVKFEIDDYTRPEMKVVAIEGEQTAVEKVYNDVSSRFINFFE